MKQQNIIQKNEFNSRVSFYPRIIREFVDNDEPMYYGGNQMDGNNLRDILPDRLHVVDVEYDIKKLSAEMEYHKSKVTLFDQAIKVQQKELDWTLKVTEKQTTNGEMYK